MVSEKSPPFPPTAVADLGRLHRSSSEWAFEWFLREATISDPAGPSSDLAGDDDVEPHGGCRAAAASVTRGTFFRRQLNAACAAYAIPWEASGLKNEASSCLSDKGSPSSDTSQMGAQAMEKEKSVACVTTRNCVLPEMQNQPGNQTKPTASCSSREQSADDEVEAEDETTGLTDPAM